MSENGKYASRLTGTIGQWSRGINQIGSHAAKTARFAVANAGRITLPQMAPIPRGIGTPGMAESKTASKTPSAARMQTSMDAAERAAGAIRAGGIAAIAARSSVTARQPSVASVTAPMKLNASDSLSARSSAANPTDVGSQRRSATQMSAGWAASRIPRMGASGSGIGGGVGHESVRSLGDPDHRSAGPGGNNIGFARAADSIGSIGRAIGTHTVTGASNVFRSTNLSAAAGFGPAQVQRQSGGATTEGTTDASARFAPVSGSTLFNRAVAPGGSSIRAASLSALASPGGRLAIAASPTEFAPLRLTVPTAASGRGNAEAGGIVVNSSPTIVIQNGEPGQIGDAVVDALRNHRAELYEEIYQEARRRMRSDF
jgi:hypothetical protein